jgi:hypothetical protein
MRLLRLLKNISRKGRAMDKKQTRSGVHHFYLGILIVLLGFWWLWQNPIWKPFLSDNSKFIIAGFLEVVIGFFILWNIPILGAILGSFGGLLILFPVFYFHVFDVPHWGVIVIIIGGFIAFDDFYQHYIQNTSNPGWRSPLHRAFGFLWKYQWIRDVTEFFNRLFGKVI